MMNDKPLIFWGLIQLPYECLDWFVERPRIIGFHEEPDVIGVSVICVAYKLDDAAVICQKHIQRQYGSVKGTAHVYLQPLDTSVGQKRLKEFGQPFVPGLIQESGLPLTWRDTEEQRESVSQFAISVLTSDTPITPEDEQWAETFLEKQDIPPEDDEQK